MIKKLETKKNMINESEDETQNIEDLGSKIAKLEEVDAAVIKS